MSSYVPIAGHTASMSSFGTFRGLPGGLGGCLCHSVEFITRDGSRAETGFKLNKTCKKMENDLCNGPVYYCWVPLALVTTIMIISLLKNISYCLKEKKRKGKIYEDYPKHSPSDSEFYTEECPVYDNLNHCHPEMLNESCYEQMNAQPHPSISDVQIVEHQMCYASLDHSVKRKQKRNKKKYPTLGMDENHLTGSKPMSSDTCIYLNSEQLSAENKLTEDTIHEDPFSVFGFIHTTNDAGFQ